MNKLWLNAVVCLLILQGCSQQPQAPQTQSAAGGPPGAPGPQGQQPPSITPEQMKKLPMSQQMYLQSQDALKQNKPQECYELLEKSIAAARQEKNLRAIILCRETEARLKLALNDAPNAVKILEGVIAEYDNGKTDVGTRMVLDRPKSVLYAVYAKTGQAKKAEDSYKQIIAIARKQNPVDHQRLAFWLKNYSDFCAFNKNDKLSKSMLAEAQAEAAKK